ncbi:S41 family peptidase [Croceicoccus gelatinilyticus]|uniref:S41 family peptidase n=1 Tax=Croceicoccus gelatinilyticus TaxID=2835536 RepID=UPI001BCBFCAB|nr:S41 family peptidase [Croceicoccus gelatinilyticus]MBS7669854.1 S41 family peptidase [Croceicoccus gelatinilyticus]
MAIRLAPFLRSAALVTALAMLPATTAGLAAVDARSAPEFGKLMVIYQRVKANYVDQVDDEKLLRGAIDGMLSSLDPHSGYLDATAFESLRTQTDGNYGGLGLSVTMEDGVVKVIAPTKGTPAENAGIKAGDYITHLDGKLIYGGTLDEAVDQMRGRPGTDIKLTIYRAGRDEPFDVDVTRAIIELTPVEWEVDGDMGVITVSSFSANVGRDVERAMNGIRTKLGKMPEGVVIDLRSNPGGLLDEAVAMSDLFLDKGQIVSQRGRFARDNESYVARTGDIARGIPLVVLIDSGSASASEIVAGALQDHHRALVMGQRSFGKGSVQTLVPLTNDSALKLTTARYYTPSGKSVQEGGIEPDIAVPQLSDPDARARAERAIRESDLRGHLINELQVEDQELEKDLIDDPRFQISAEELEQQGIEDFQLHYALDTLRNTRLAQKHIGAAKP